MPKNEHDGLPATLTFKPDTKTVEAWFARMPITTKDPDEIEKREKLKKFKGTEAELLAKGLQASRRTLEDFIRRALVTAAKTYLVNADSKLDRIHAAAYRELQRQKVQNITPSRLYLEAKTNFRSAEAWLDANGHAYTSSADPNKPRKPRGSSVAKAPKKRAPAARKKTGTKR